MVFFLIMPNFVSAETFSLRECNEMASEVNSTMSNMKVDSITIMKNAVCIYPVILNYNYDLTISASKVDMDFASMKK